MVKYFLLIGFFSLSFAHLINAGSGPIREMALTTNNYETTSTAASSQRLLAIGQQIAQSSAQSKKGSSFVVKALDQNTVIVETISEDTVLVFFKKALRILRQYDQREFAHFLTTWSTYINCKDQNGDTLLHKAAQLAKVNAIKELCSRRIAIDARNNKGMTALHDASKNGAIEVIRELLKNSAEILEDKHGRIPLHIACKEGHQPIVELFLLSDESPINAQTTQGVTCLTYAVSFNHTTLIELLLNKGADINHKDQQGNTPLHEAALYGNNSTAEVLIRRGALVQNVNKFGDSPLSIAISMNKQQPNNLPIIAMMIEVCNPQLIAKNGTTILHMTAQAGLVEPTIQLIRRGADANASDTEGRTPLHYAAQSNWQTIPILIENKALTNAKDKNDSRPLHYAIAANNIPALIFLLGASDIDINAQDNKGTTPLHSACGKWDDRITRKTGLYSADKKSHEEAIPYLIHNKANIETKDEVGFTALHWAAEANNKKALLMLLEAGACVNAQNNGSETALHIVARHNNCELAEVLFHYNIDSSICDHDGRTALSIARNNCYGEIAMLIRNKQSCAIQ